MPTDQELLAIIKSALAAREPERQAVIAMPTAAQLGGAQPLPFARFPFYPTAPWYSTNPNVGYQVRFYGTTLLPTDADYVVGTEALRTIQFDLPCRIIGINGAAFATAGALLTVNDMNLQYLFRMDSSTNDRLHTAARLADTVVGRGPFPGEIGGHGYNVDQGGSLQCGITPLRATVRIDITLICLEMRAPQNFSIR